MFLVNYCFYCIFKIIMYNLLYQFKQYQTISVNLKESHPISISAASSAFLSGEIVRR